MVLDVRLGFVTHGQARLAVDVGNVPLDRAHAQHQFVGDLAIAETPRQQFQYFQLTRGQTVCGALGRAGIGYGLVAAPRASS